MINKNKKHFITNNFFTDSTLYKLINQFIFAIAFVYYFLLNNK